MSRGEPPSSAPDSGFALVELLVSLAILAVLTSVSVLALRAPGQDAAEAEARRLAARVDAASDRALLENRPMVLSWTDAGYSLADARGSRAPPDQFEFRGGVSLIEPSRQGQLMIDPSAGGASVDLVLGANGPRWRVAYDGLNTRVDPAGPP